MAVKGIATPWPCIKGAHYRQFYSWKHTYIVLSEYCYLSNIRQSQLNYHFSDKSQMWTSENLLPEPDMLPQMFSAKDFLLAPRLLVAIATSGCHPQRPSVLLFAVQKKKEAAWKGQTHTNIHLSKQTWKHTMRIEKNSHIYAHWYS